MDFTQGDRDMLKAHDIKLENLCTMTDKMNTTLDDIDDKLGAGAVICVEKRSACRKEIDKDFIKTKTFWSVISVLILGFLAKIFFIE